MYPKENPAQKINPINKLFQKPITKQSKYNIALLNYKSYL